MHNDDLDLEDDYYNNNFFGYKNHKPFKWFSNGVAYSINELTDKHLENALKYEYNHRGHTDAFLKLKEEFIKRKNIKFFKQTIKCSFCGQIMYMKEFHEADRMEVGMWFPQKWFQYECECGARSNYITKPDFEKTIYES
jgi:hypothetical protein